MLEFMTTIQVKKLTEPGLEIDPEVFKKLLALDGAAQDYFGNSVATTADGTTIVIGATGDDDKGSSSGSVYVFTKQANDNYIQAQKLIATDGAANENFGKAVDISSDGTTIVVGAFGDGDKGAFSGSIYIFTKQVNGSYLRTQKILASDGATDDTFGQTVAISGDGTTILVNATGDDDKGSSSGSAYIFTKQANGNYLQLQKLVASDGAANDIFSTAIAISDDTSTIVVGAKWDDDKGSNSGSAYIFKKQANGSYLQTQKLVALDGAADDYFGGFVAISANGDTLLVSSTGDDDKGSNSGSTYIFTKQANGSYLQSQKLVASDGAAGDAFGFSVVISNDGSTIIVSAYRDNDKGNLSGSVYIFTKQVSGSYLETQKLLASDGAAGDQFGISVAVSQTSVVISAQNHLTKGAVYVY